MTEDSRCPATWEAVWEALKEGDIGCPLCGGTLEDHESEAVDICEEAIFVAECLESAERRGIILGGETQTVTARVLRELVARVSHHVA